MKANDAMFLVWAPGESSAGRLEIVSRAAYLAKGLGSDCTHTFGAVYSEWRVIPTNRIMECVLWVGFEVAGAYGVPIKAVMAELEKIEGFTDYWNRVGEKACSL